MLVLGCGKESRESSPPVPVVHDARAAVAVVDARSAIDAGPPRKLFVTGAGRCGECHEKMYDEWEVSAHAKAESSTLYKTSLASSKDPACERCHAPLVAAGGNALIASEGVTCDVCHTLRDPVASPTGGNFRLAIDDMVKFGPRCNLKDHYFHRMGCSPEHAKAIICAACHLWELNGIPVFTEYSDYLAGPAAAKGQQCQDCHMPSERAALATGSPVRDGVPHHGLLGLATDLRKRALALDVAEKDENGALAVTVTVSNVTAGHTVPSGLPERRIVVRVHVRDATGAELEMQSRSLGRVLVDAHGAEVPFWKATKVGSDTRIPAGGEWHETFAFHPSAAGSVEVEVVYRALSEAITGQFGVADVEEQPMTSAKLAFGAPGARTPKSVSVKPNAAGARKPK